MDAVGVTFSDCLRNDDLRLALPAVRPNEPLADGRLGCECVATIRFIFYYDKEEEQEREKRKQRLGSKLMG